MSDELKACPFCGETLRINNARLAVHSRDSECLLRQQPIVVDDKDQVERWNTRATHPAAASVGGGEAVEVVASIAVDAEGVVQDFTLDPGLDRHRGGYTVMPLMTVTQHQRILAASAGSDKPIAWREHSVNYAKGEKCPETIETLQAAWDRDQELINDMRHEIARHKTRINRLEQRRPAGQVAEAVAWLTSDKRHLVFSGALDQSQYVEQGMTPLYTHPAGQVADDLTMVKVPRELLEEIVELHRRRGVVLIIHVEQLAELLNGGQK